MTTFSLLGWLFEVTLKGSVVIALVAVATSLFGNRLSARWRHALWLIVLVRLAVPIAPSSTWSIFNLVPSPRIAPVTAGAVTLRVNAQQAGVHVTPLLRTVETTWWGRHGTTVLTIWGAGLLLILLRLLLASRRLAADVKRAEASRDAEASLRIGAVVREAQAQIGIDRYIQVVVAASVKTPGLHGIFQPKLLLPEVVAREFGHREVRHIVLHELWHLRRHDIAVNWLLSLLQAVHWFNPLVWYAVARIREEREICCDELALSCLEEDERYGYGGTILRLLEEFRTAAPVPALVGIVNHKQLMKRRLSMIATFPSRKRSTVLFLGVMTFVGAVAFTDANGGDAKRVMRRMHPASHGEMAKFHERVSLSVTNASFNDFLASVSAATGVTITPSAEIADNKVQTARFTVAATNVPAHLVMIEALAPFQLAPQPNENGISIVAGGELFIRHDGNVTVDTSRTGEKRVIRIVEKEKVADSTSTDATAEGGVTQKRITILEKGAPGEKNEEFTIVRDGVPAGDGEKHRFEIRALGGHGGSQLDENGELHKDMKLKLNINGEESEGTLKLDITTK